MSDLADSHQEPAMCQSTKELLLHGQSHRFLPTELSASFLVPILEWCCCLSCFSFTNISSLATYTGGDWRLPFTIVLRLEVLDVCF
ncbi:hypothetical protein DAPPUDRAFT_263183 [Daphnia pulex]|uniref:Uncharacterized protein n=1 Tax=Daphnia pulex TaxID=6669 RepID=E9HP98_DAPPU|nr:hypothetical protein DAPPUDRAFT_263183 [Daphnia pulex]|eukprot:EFX66445.1 hypothetical protein DAPPUDRAFT_263183 [Daphnia pulex]